MLTRLWRFAVATEGRQWPCWGVSAVALLRQIAALTANINFLAVTQKQCRITDTSAVAGRCSCARASDGRMSPAWRSSSQLHFPGSLLRAAGFEQLRSLLRWEGLSFSLEAAAPTGALRFGERQHYHCDERLLSR